MSENGFLGMYTCLKQNRIFCFFFFQRTIYVGITTIKMKLFPFAESLKVFIQGLSHVKCAVFRFSLLYLQFYFVFKGLRVVYKPPLWSFRQKLSTVNCTKNISGTLKQYFVLFNHFHLCFCKRIALGRGGKSSLFAPFSKGECHHVLPPALVSLAQTSRDIFPKGTILRNNRKISKGNAKTYNTL